MVHLGVKGAGSSSYQSSNEEDVDSLVGFDFKWSLGSRNWRKWPNPWLFLWDTAISGLVSEDASDAMFTILFLWSSMAGFEGVLGESWEIFSTTVVVLVVITVLVLVVLLVVVLEEFDVLLVFYP